MRAIAHTLRDLLVQQQLVYTRDNTLYVRADGFLLCAHLLKIQTSIVQMEPLEIEGGTHFLVKAVATRENLQNEGYALCGPTDPGHEDRIHSRALALAQTRALARAVRPLVAPYLVLTNLSATIAEELPAIEMLNRFSHQAQPEHGTQRQTTPTPPSQRQPTQGAQRQTTPPPQRQATQGAQEDTSSNYPDALNKISNSNKRQHAIRIWNEAMRKLQSDEVQQLTELLNCAATEYSVQSIIEAAHRRLQTISY